MKIGIFIPAYYAETTIQKVISSIPKDFVDKAYEIFVIDDASEDKTYERALNYKEKIRLNKLKVIKNEKNLGYGGNQKKAYNYAIKNDFDVIIMLHGDLQYPAQLIQALSEKIESKKADMAMGSRISGDPFKGKMPFWKFIGNKFLTFLENRSFKLNLTEYHSGFRAFNVHALKEIDFNQNSDDYIFDQEIIAQLVKNKKKFAEISIPTYYGPGSHKISFLKSAKYGLQILKLLYFKRKWKKYY